jgi:hypothetical protein
MLHLNGLIKGKIFLTGKTFDTIPFTPFSLKIKHLNGT